MAQSKLKALILAGGFGTRLRPLSCTRPKLLFPIINRPMLDWVLEGLAKGGVDEVILAVSYLAQELKREIGPSKYGLDIRYSHERKPLGTGGPIKKAQDLIGDETFFVLNGDVLCNVDYQSLLDFHERSEATMTITLHEVEDVSRYGVVQIGSDNRISRFVEKPKLEEISSRLINAGIYVADPKIFDYIPSETSISLEMEVFPRLANEGRLYGYRYDGFWVDIGLPEDYAKASFAFLDKVARKKPVIGEGTKISKDIEIIPPVAISEEVEIKEARIGPYVSIGDGCVVERRSRIERSILFSGVWVDESSFIRNAIIGEGAIIGKWVRIEDVIVGDGAIIHDNLTLMRDVKVCPSREVTESIIGPKQVM